MPVLKLEVFTFDKNTLEKLNGTTIQLEDLTDHSIKTIVIKNDRKNDFYFDIVPGHEYELIATKPGYSTDVQKINTKGALGTIKKEMFLSRQDLLPLSLYFDNDYPNPRSRSTKTSNSYVPLADNYLLRRQEYIERFAGSLTGDEKTSSVSEITSFFENDVRRGKENLILFLTQLEPILHNGDKIVLEIRGFASPRSTTGYNKILSYRRINSIKNEISAFNNGILSSYLKNKSLQLKFVGFGDTKSQPGVIGDIKDERNSIYNLNAARERRVEIIKVNIN